MKKLLIKLPLLFLTLFSFLGCADIKRENEYDYSLVEHLKIEWKDLFSQSKLGYFVYIYQKHCFYCNELKDEIIPFSLAETYPTYFIEYSKEIPIGEDIESTLNKRSIDEVFIKGVPTLLGIYNGKIDFNIAGLVEISDKLNSFTYRT